MKKEKVFYSELAFLLGLIMLAFGCSLMEKADFGVSMVVAPAYLIHLKVSQVLPFYTFGMSGYVFQGLLLAVLALALGRFKKHYLLSFVTAVVYGLMLDGMMALVALIPFDSIPWRLCYYCIGLPCSSLGVALVLHTYLPPEAYEVVVKEICQKFSFPVGKVKTAYDCSSCVLAIVLSFCFFGFGTFVGVNWGTVVCALCNGFLIGRVSRFLENRFQFRDALPFRSKCS